MADTQAILKMSRELGQLIAGHEAAKRMGVAQDALEGDRDAQRAIADLERFARTLGQKQQEGKPIEVEEKRKLEQLQQGMAMNVLIQRLQMAQMDYLDLLRQVNEAIAEEAGSGSKSEEAGSGTMM